MGYNSIAWLPLCAGLTAIGLVLSYLAFRRRGRLSGLRGVAWSLLPIAAYLTGSVEMFWKIGAAIGHYADGFVFSPVRWAGVGVAGLAALLFFATSGRRRRRTARLARKTAGQRGAGPGAGPGAVTPGTPETTRDLGLAKILEEAKRPGAGAKTSAANAPASPGQPAKPAKSATAGPPDEGDDMKDIEDILRKRGI